MRVRKRSARLSQQEVDRLVVSEADNPNAWDKPIRVRPKVRRGGNRRPVRAAAKKPPSLSSALDRVDRGERVVLRRGRKPVAAVVPIKDLRLLEEIEDRRDAELARKALAEPGRVGYREVLPKP
jgi:antitoxin (DNA-binding transcriptional repressor) of toxin-antitoxin stability system